MPDTPSIEQQLEAPVNVSRLKFSLREICSLLSYSCSLAWLLLLLGANFESSFSDGVLLSHCMSLAVLLGASLTFALSYWFSAVLRKLQSQRLWLLVFVLVAIVSLILILIPLQNSVLWLVVLMITRLASGLIIGSTVIFFVNEIIANESRGAMLWPIAGTIFATLIYLLIINLATQAALISQICLPLISAVMILSVQHQSTVHNLSTVKPTFNQISLLNDLDITDRRPFGDEAIQQLGILEKACGLLTYGLIAGSAAGICIEALGEAFYDIKENLSYIVTIEIMIIAIALAISLKLLFGKNYLRLPQWSFYVIGACALLFIPLAPNAIVKIVFGGLVVATALYYYTIDIIVISQMAEQRSADPYRLFGLYEAIFTLAVFCGWGLLTVLSQVLDNSYSLASSIVALVIVGITVGSMTFMRQLYYNAMFYRSVGSRSGEWRKRCISLGVEYKLSKREVEVLELLVKGRSATYIKDKFVISNSTVKTHVNNIYHKLSIHSRQDLINLFEQRNK